MKILTEVEVNDVTGGGAALVVTVVIAAVGMAGGVFAFSYGVGQDLAERDNSLGCPVPNGP